MKPLLTFLIFALIVSNVRAEPAEGSISAVVVNERPANVLKVLERWSGKEVIASSQVLESKTGVRFKINKEPKSQAIVVLIAALRKAGIEVREVEGKWIAELAQPPESDRTR